MLHSVFLDFSSRIGQIRRRPALSQRRETKARGDCAAAWSRRFVVSAGWCWHACGCARASSVLSVRCDQTAKVRGRNAELPLHAAARGQLPVVEALLAVHSGQVQGGADGVDQTRLNRLHRVAYGPSGHPHSPPMHIITPSLRTVAMPTHPASTKRAAPIGTAPTGVRGRIYWATWRVASIRTPRRRR